MYEPHFIASHGFVLSGATLAELSRAEMELSRLEARVELDRSREALSQNLARLEAIATLRIDGEKPLIEDLLRISSRYEIMNLENIEDGGEGLRIDEFLALGQHGFSRSAIDAFKYLETIKWIVRTVDESFRFTPDFLLDIHSMCLFGNRAAQSGIAFRSRPHSCGKASQTVSMSYLPPDPSRVLDFIDDLCLFENRNLYSPIAQAALAHFQFEGIKPFKTALDRTGRAMSHAIMRRRGFFRKTVVPIALMPAIDTRAHAIRLLPYQRGSEMQGRSKAHVLDEWVRFCAHSSHVAAMAMRTHLETCTALERHWRNRMGKISKGSAVEELILAFIGNPLMTVSHASRLIGRGISATNDAMNRLLQEGIVHCEELPGARNRLFVADESIVLLDRMERCMTQKDPISRDDALFDFSGAV
ncbi:hypothetical protein JI75_06385 [Berryella intestinalis]|uniref:Fido domain-containing protein n=1 Tax=Berryella intestinalis TaxID=1531429 RepID=A0A0A8BAY0_9ACTN|nr:Fic family protein [Berryella intestinalis]AJC12337.1 hypothetical protein JI75_06385 [Berryella intestinalis]